MENNFCPFCVKETTDDLDVHGQNCSEYQESLRTNNCPFCSCLIGACWVQQHSNYRKAMKSKKEKINEYFGDQYCTYCDEETDLTLKEHGKTCPEYKKAVKDNICPICETQIDECCNEQHVKYR